MTMPAQKTTETQPTPKRTRKSPPNRFILAARFESELKANGTVIANAQKRLAEAIEKRKAIVDKIPAEIRELLGIAENGAGE